MSFIYYTCRVAGSEWALQMAKYNLVNQYLIVGLTEEMEDFVAVLEAVLPRYFAGALDLYVTGNKSDCGLSSVSV